MSMFSNRTLIKAEIIRKYLMDIAGFNPPSNQDPKQNRWTTHGTFKMIGLIDIFLM